jgi:hypothetical protein
VGVLSIGELSFGSPLLGVKEMIAKVRERQWLWLEAVDNRLLER